MPTKGFGPGRLWAELGAFGVILWKHIENKFIASIDLSTYIY
jgi:hypothetical protein